MGLKLMIDVFESDLEPDRRLVALVYANSANDLDGSTWPSIWTVSRMTGLTEKEVVAVLRSLETDKILIYDGSTEKGDYRFLLDRTALLDYKRPEARP